MNEKLRFLWLLAVVVFSLLFHHFWANAIEAIGKVIAMNLISVTWLAESTAGMFGMFFLR